MYRSDLLLSLTGSNRVHRRGYPLIMLLEQSLPVKAWHRRSNKGSEKTGQQHQNCQSGRVAIYVLHRIDQPATAGLHSEVWKN